MKRLLCTMCLLIALALTGSGVAVVTPFNEDLSVDFDSLKNLIEFQIKNNTDAIIICGTTGESSTLSNEEHLEVIRFTVDTVNKRIPVVAGAGSNDTQHGIYLCTEAQKAGADGLLVVTPYYNKTTQKGLIEHYKMMASSVDLPIILYNIAGRTGLNITPQTVYELSKIENIVGIKEASGNISQVAQIAALCGEDFGIYSGNDNEILPLLALGGKGVISVIANIMPQETHDLVQKFLDGDVKGSRDLQLKILPLVSALFLEVNPIPVKAGLNLMGMNAGTYRRPLLEMEPHNLEVLKKEMENLGLI